MGSSCSSRQKDKDRDSNRSQDSPTYQVAPSRPGGVGGDPSSCNHAAPPQQATGAPPPQPPTADLTNNVKAKPDRGPRAQSTSTSDGGDTDATQLPPSLSKLPENLRHLVLGRTASARVYARSKKISIYVCAADSQDCCMEKGILHQHVYPALRKECLARGYELHIVDLHWKTPLEKKQDHEFPELCLGELARQQDTAYVVPVLFLNQSLGTPLLPKTLETQDFEMALSKAENKSLLNKWYSLDSHSQPPCYTLRPGSCHIPGLREGTSAQDRALEEWGEEIERTLGVLIDVMATDLRDTYLSTTVEQEVHNTVCMSQELARRTVWVHRTYTHQPPANAAAKPADPTPTQSELQRRLAVLHEDLKNQLVEKHIVRLSLRWSKKDLEDTADRKEYETDVIEQMRKALRGVVESVMDEDQSKAVGKPGFGLDNRLVQELAHQTSVCQQAAQCSVNREGVLAQIKSYVEGSSRHPLVVTGPRGCGKTTLIARAAQCCGSWPGSPLLAVRFVGVSADSMTTERIVASVAQQCQVLLDGGHCWSSHRVDCWAEKLPELMGAVAEKRTLVVMVDGLDQLKPFGSLALGWVPRQLPKNVKLILSVLDSSTGCAGIKERASGNVITMPALDEAETRNILNAWVMQYNHSVPKRVEDCAKGCTLPLYAKVLAWQTSWAELESDMAPKGNVQDQLLVLLDQLEATLGKDQVQHAVAVLCAAKYGLTDSEMLDILAFNESFHSKTTYVPWAPACLFWARFNKLLTPFLQWVLCGDSLVLQWGCASLRDLLATRYLDKARKTAALALLGYFEGSWSRTTALLGRIPSMTDLSDKCYNQRKLQELPYVYYQVHGSIKKNFLLNLEWIFKKVCGADVFQILEDILLERSEDADLSWLRSALEESATALAFDGRQLFSQLFRRLARDFPAAPHPPAGPGDPGPEPRDWVSIPGNRAFPKNVLSACESPSVPVLIPLPAQAPPDSPDHLDLVVRIRDYPDYVVTVSTAREEIAVWDVLRCERVRLLKGIPQPLNLQPIDSHRCIVLCQRELRLYDLDACTLLSKLKGVMNQKMPYFGLHDKSHLVALSRNRMYVNLMNLDSGDCIATFKAGEDRFLNSLLVSGDGRVLVCGDETQKPFPLLVWNLASRKLLYDLRIPHHDFITSLAAITHEGHYVCCVAQEVDEPTTANFIVVYDLQSGTLFKKWKPGVNTVSLDISSRDGCVISGLEDGRVLVWDLITGNCRWTLSGHTAPVDFLRLDAQGGCFLSADSKCRDRSLRLWDLNQGELVAVYTAERPVTACEVTLGGEVLVLAQEGSGHPTTLLLRGRAPLSSPSHSPAHTIAPDKPRRFFGDLANNGRSVDFREGER